MKVMLAMKQNAEGMEHETNISSYGRAVFFRNKDVTPPVKVAGEFCLI